MDVDMDNEIIALENKLERLKHLRNASADPFCKGAQLKHEPLHNLLLLSDSALPLGSFAFSAGLESFLAHIGKQPPSRLISHFKDFLHLSIESLAGLTLPFVHRAWSDPGALDDLDNDLDASTTCTVARRASIAQGRALLTMWQKSLQPHFSPTHSKLEAAHDTLQAFAQRLNRVDLDNLSSSPSCDAWDELPSSHFAPLFGALSAVMNLSAQQTLYLYLLNHTKMVLSAAIRASVIGPYQSQGLLASDSLERHIHNLVDNQVDCGTCTYDAVQQVPALDIWSGRHELVYSRIFNS